MSAFSRTSILAIVLSVLALPLWASQMVPAEQDRVQYLISHIENMKDAAFVRNGSAYGSRIAAYFLKKKWEANQDKIRTADDFIETVATKSSTTGRPYLIRFKNGKEVECGRYLHEVDTEHGSGSR
jgi:hypothetical protein